MRTFQTRTYEELQKEWGKSTCGRSIEMFIYDELTLQINNWKTMYELVKEENERKGKRLYELLHSKSVGGN